MTRKFLEDMGLSKEQIDKILDENSQDIGKAKGEVDDVKQKLETAEKEINTLKETVKERDGQLESLKKSTGDVEGLKKQIGELQEANKKKDEEHAKEVQNLKVNAAVDSALSAAKAKNKIAVRALLKDLDKAEILEDGTIKGLSEQIAALVKAEDSKFLFEAEESKKPQFRGTKPGEASDMKHSSDVTKDEFAKMGYKERVNLYNENRELYDSLVK